MEEEYLASDRALFAIVCCKLEQEEKPLQQYFFA